MLDKIGRFEILSEIARTPAGCIYKASDPDSGQIVGLKIINLELLGESAPALVQQILEEAETTKPLNSHNIALLYGAGEIDGQFCAAMEYVQGKSLAAMLAQQETFSVWDLQDIARQACQALDHAHAHQVVHRCLEPGKILVSWDGTVKVLGFGISAMGAHAAQASGGAPEALHYMSPEQVRGEPLDARSNLFSLGAILYEMVTDRKAFGGEDAEQLRQEIAVGMPVAPAQILSKMHPALSELIMKALAKDPEQRYQSGQELVVDLEKCKDSPQKAAPRKTPEPEAQRATETPANENTSFFGKKAAAAAAGWSGSPSAEAEVSVRPDWGKSDFTPPDLAKADLAKTDFAQSDFARSDFAKPAAETMSAAWPTEAETEAPASPSAPRNGDQGQVAGKRTRSFSDVAELPPLKEVYIPPPPPPVADEPPVRESAPPATVFQESAPGEKPKTPPAEIAKRAVAEIQKIPPKLFLYAIGAAVLIILLVIVGIVSRNHSENSAETGAPAQTAAPAAASDQTQASASQPSAAQQAAPMQVPTPVEAQPSSPAAERPVISVAPKHSRRKSGKVAPPPAPVVVPGQLTINSTPEGAQVLVDGHHNPNWVTPFDMTGLAPGQHLVSISKLGYSPETRSIDVASGSKSFLVVQLAQLGAGAFVSSVPVGAEVFMDGKDMGRVTPAQIQLDRPGTHIFTVRKQGYLEESTTGNLQAGQTFQFAPVLRALGDADDIKMGGKFKRMFGGGETAGMGMVTLKTQPKGAQIAVNRHLLDKTSPVEFYLNPGTYIIDITLSGYQSVHKVVNVDKGGKYMVDETMDRQ